MKNLKLILYILKPDFYSYDIIKNVKIYIENIPIENKFKWNIIWKKLKFGKNKKHHVTRMRNFFLYVCEMMKE